MTKEKKTFLFSEIQKIKQSLLNLGYFACKGDFTNYGKCEMDIIIILDYLKEFIKDCK